MPAVSVAVFRSNPVPWLTMTTLARRITAPFLSVIVPETAASCDCDHAHVGSRASHRMKSKRVAEAKKRTKSQTDAQRRPGERDWSGALLMSRQTLLQSFPRVWPKIALLFARQSRLRGRENVRSAFFVARAFPSSASCAASNKILLSSPGHYCTLVSVRPDQTCRGGAQLAIQP